MRIKVLPALVVVVVGKNILKIRRPSAINLKGSMWGSFFWKVPLDLMEIDDLQ